MKFKKKAIFLVGALCIAVGGGVLILANEDTTSAMMEEQVSVKDIKTYYTFSGEIKAKNSQTVSLNANTKVSEILVEEGNMVKEGDTLFKLSSGNRVKADIDGMVTEIFVNEDIKYNSGTHMATIVENNALQVEINVNEYDVNSVKLGDEVEVYVNSLDKTVEGKIVNLSQKATVSNGISYFRAVIEIEETEDILVGMSVEVKAIKDDVKDVKVISVDSLEFDSENQPYVYVKDSNGNLVERPITIGVNNGDIVEVKTGLKENERVYSDGKEELFNPFEMMQNGGK